MNLLEKFNQTFIDFIEDLCTAYPTDGDLRMYKFMLSTAVMADKSTIQKLFYKNVVSIYQHQIAKEDEAFFIKKDYSKLANKMSGAGEVIDKLKVYWTDMSEENKRVVWKYMKVLVILAKRIYHEQQ